MTTPASAPTLHRAEDHWLLELGDGENRLSPPWLAALDDCLDAVEAAPPPALVTAAVGKVWSTGLDLDWMASHPEASADYVRRVQRLLARVLRLPTATVAAVQGHAFAAGAMLALAHDARVMRADRGWFCLPEIDLGLPFPAGMSALVQAKLPARTAHEAMTSGRRYGGADALAAGIVDAAVDEPAVRARARELARERGGKNGALLAGIRAGLYEPVLAALEA